MITEPAPIGAGRFVVPGNRWDLMSAGRGSVAAPEISVVVPFFENQHDLDLLLAGLSVQTHPLGRLQVIIADDGSAVPPTVPDLALGLDITIVGQENAGFRAGTARNLGVQHSDGQVILFLDGDTVPSPEYVAALGHLPAVLPDAVVSGRRRYADLSGWTPSELLAWFAGQAPAPSLWEEPAWMTQEYRRTDNLLTVHPRSYKYLIGAVLGCAREMFDRTGGFDETITGYGGEDYDFTYRAYNAGAVLAHVPEAVAWHDGPDWSGRTAPQEQNAQKNREVLMLAERIPEPSMRGRGQTYPIADVVVTVHPDCWSLGASVLCIRSLLETLDCAVLIEGREPSTDMLRHTFRDDPRVRTGPPDAVGHEALTDRARLQVCAKEPVTAGRGFADLLERMVEGDTGTLSISGDRGLVIRVESTRSRRRRMTDETLLAAGLLFPHLVLDVDSSGLQLLAAEPRLAAVFGGYS